MSWFGIGTQALARYGGCWLSNGPRMAVRSVAIPLSQSIRQVSTTRSKKAQALKEPGDAAKEKKSKASAAKSPSKKAAKAAAAEVTQQPHPVAPVKPKAKKTKKASATKAAVAKAPAAPETPTKSASQAPAKPASTASSAKSNGGTPNAHSWPHIPKAGTTTIAQQAASRSASASGPSSKATVGLRPIPAAAQASSPKLPAAGKERPKINTSSPEYKKAKSKWVRAMVALPILIYTSYVLFDRLVLGNNFSMEDLCRLASEITGKVIGGEHSPQALEDTEAIKS